MSDHFDNIRTLSRTMQRRGQKPLLGIVDSRGVVRFSGDKAACIEFLRAAGLEMDGVLGWCRVSRGLLGILHPQQGGPYAAAYWKSEIL